MNHHHHNHYYCLYRFVIIIILSLISTAYGYNSKINQILYMRSAETRCWQHLLSPDVISDDAFTTSSFHLNKSEFSAPKARLVNVFGSSYPPGDGTAWCPGSKVGQGMAQWIQIDFSGVQLITGVYTRGRGDGNFVEYVPSIKIRYRRSKLQSFTDYLTKKNESIIHINTDARTISRTMFKPAIIASSLRIYPFDHTNAKIVCIKFALYGCNFDESPVSYIVEPITNQIKTPESVIQQDELFKLNRNLGILTDNKAWMDTLSSTYNDKYFQGWYFDKRPSKVKLTFIYDEVRRFTRLLIFLHWLPKQSIGLFSELSVHLFAHKLLRDRTQHRPIASCQVTKPSNHVQVEPSGAAIFSLDLQMQASACQPLHSAYYNKSDGSGADASTVVIEIDCPLRSWLLISEVYIKSTPSSMSQGELLHSLYNISIQSVSTQAPRPIDLQHTQRSNPISHTESQFNENFRHGQLLYDNKHRLGNNLLHGSRLYSAKWAIIATICAIVLVGMALSCGWLLYYHGRRGQHHHSNSAMMSHHGYNCTGDTHTTTASCYSCLLDWMTNRKLRLILANGRISRRSGIMHSDHSQAVGAGSVVGGNEKWTPSKWQPTIANQYSSQHGFRNQSPRLTLEHGHECTSDEDVASAIYQQYTQIDKEYSKQMIGQFNLNPYKSIGSCTPTSCSSPINYPFAPSANGNQGSATGYYDDVISNMTSPTRPDLTAGVPPFGGPLLLSNSNKQGIAPAASPPIVVQASTISTSANETKHNSTTTTLPRRTRAASIGCQYGLPWPALPSDSNWISMPTADYCDNNNNSSADDCETMLLLGNQQPLPQLHHHQHISALYPRNIHHINKSSPHNFSVQNFDLVNRNSPVGHGSSRLHLLTSSASITPIHTNAHTTQYPASMTSSPAHHYMQPPSRDTLMLSHNPLPLSPLPTSQLPDNIQIITNTHVSSQSPLHSSVSHQRFYHQSLNRLPSIESPCGYIAMTQTLASSSDDDGSSLITSRSSEIGSLSSNESSSSSSTSLSPVHRSLIVLDQSQLLPALASTNQQTPTNRRLISQGRAGVTWLATLDCIDRHQPVLITFLNNNRTISSRDKRRIRQEVRLLRSLQHKHLNELQGLIINDGPTTVRQSPIGFWFKYPPMDLHKFISSNTSCLGVKLVLGISAQICSGMMYLEERSIVHRDLACRNIHVNPYSASHAPQVCISTACTSARINYPQDYWPLYHPTDSTSRNCSPVYLPIRWMSPEVLLQGQFSHKSDVWSFSTLVWEMCTSCQTIPYPHLTNSQLLVTTPGTQARPSYHCTKELYDLMCTAWSHLPNHRPHFSELHHFFTSQLNSRPLYSHLDALHRTSII